MRMNGQPIKIVKLRLLSQLLLLSAVTPPKPTFVVIFAASPPKCLNWASPTKCSNCSFCCVYPRPAHQNVQTQHSEATFAHVRSQPTWLKTTQYETACLDKAVRRSFQGAAPLHSDSLHRVACHSLRKAAQKTFARLHCPLPHFTLFPFTLSMDLFGLTLVYIYIHVCIYIYIYIYIYAHI